MVQQLRQKLLDEQRKGANLVAQVTPLQHQLLQMQQDVQTQLHQTKMSRNLSVEAEQAEELIALRQQVTAIRHEKEVRVLFCSC
jgi:hypothetical protein